MTFTAHLAKTTGLQLCKPGKRTETRDRDFGYDCSYRIVADLGATPALITAVDKDTIDKLPLFPEDSWLVLHDPTEFNDERLQLFRRFRIVTIRKSVQELLAAKGIESRFLLHPFYAYPKPEPVPKMRAVSISRIDFDKNIHIILDANEKLADDKRIALYGATNRLYVYHKLKKEAFGAAYLWSFGKSWDALGNILKDAGWVVDMSTIKKDGGGSQYTFLEAIYSGAALVLHKKWIEGGPGPFIPGENCLAVGSGEELAEALAGQDPRPLAAGAQDLLLPHLQVDWMTELGLQA